MSVTLEQTKALEEMLGKLSDEQKAKLFKHQIEHKPMWVPNAGPQMEAYYSEADELFYGGMAGGGKTDLGIGLSLTKHKNSLVMRRQHKQASKLVERFMNIIGNRDGYNGQDQIWRLNTEGVDRVIDIAGCQHEDDKQKFKGIPHDLIFFDEVSDFSESQYRFIIGWNRSADVKQRCRIVSAGNPPTSPEGFWVLNYWGAWLDEQHPMFGKVKPGELLWYTTIEGEDTLVDGPGPHEVKNSDGTTMMLKARSRTFIPGRLQDNPDLAETNYLSNLAAMPEEIRAAYMEGRWDAGKKDHAHQVIPTHWVMQAQARWKKDGWMGTTMTSIAVDPAGGGRDAEEIIYRHGAWLSEPVTTKSKDTANGSLTAARVVMLRKHDCPVIVDVGGGYGGALKMRLDDNGIQMHPFNGAAKSHSKTRDGSLAFANQRSEAWWRVREELDPDQEGGAQIALPPGNEVLMDLTTPRFHVGPNGIQVETKDDIRERLKRSPGKGDVIVMSLAYGQEIITRQLYKESRRRRPLRVVRKDPNKRR